MNKMSDSDSDSEFDETLFDEVLVQLTVVHDLQEDAYVRLQRLQRIDSTLPKECLPWDRIEALHASALQEIAQTGFSTFSASLHALLKN